MQTPPKKSKAERDLATACGGKRINVMRHDGREENVFVRQLPLRLLERYIELALAGDEQRRIEFCIGESVEWDKKYHNKRTADRFTTEAQAALIALADELNFQPALSQIERRKNTIGGLEPFLKRLYAVQAAQMENAFKTMVDSAVSSLTASLSSAGLTLNSGTAGASTSSPSPSTGTPPITTRATDSPPPATSSPPTTP